MYESDFDEDTLVQTLVFPMDRNKQ